MSRTAAPTYEELEERFYVATQTQDIVAMRQTASQLSQFEGDAAQTFGLYCDAFALYVEGRRTEALLPARRALAYYEAQSDIGRMCVTELLLGAIHVDLDDFSAAMSLFSSAIDKAQRTGNLRIEGAATSNLAMFYANQGDLVKAIKMLMRAVELHREVGHRLNEANTCVLIGSAYDSLERTEEALTWTERARLIYLEEGHMPGAVSCDSNSGWALYRAGRLEEAREVLERVYEIVRGESDLSAETHVHSNYSILLTDLEEYDRARKVLDEHAALPVLSSTARSDAFYARAHLELGQGRLDEAEDALQQAFAMAPSDALVKLVELHKKARDVAKMRGDFEGYIKHNEEYQRISTEIRGSEALRKLSLAERERELEEERRRTEQHRAALHATLPSHVADRLIRGEDVSGDYFDNASVLFLDIVGFTTISDRIPPGHVVHLLKAIFRVCDEACKQHGLTKIKTIGDSYMAVAGVPEPLDDHAQRAASAALDMMRGLNMLELKMDPALGDTTWTKDVGEIQVRIGLHCGPVVAGIVGDERLQYDVWGDTVNTASRMESTGEAGRIQCSEAFAQVLLSAAVAERDGATNSNSQQQLTERGEVNIKGKGSMTTYWLEGS